MQRVAKLMKECARIIKTQKAGLLLVTFGKIQNINDDRLNLAVEPLLLAEGIHPGSAALRWSCEIITDEQRDFASIARHNSPATRIPMVEGNVLAFTKGKAKETIRGEKRGCNHVFKLKI